MTPLPFAPPVAPMLAKPGGSSVPDPDSVDFGRARVQIDDAIGWLMLGVFVF